MRQAVLDFDEDSVLEWGFDVFDDAGLLDIEVLSCEGRRGVSRIHLAEQPDEEALDALEHVEWWERVADDGAEYVYIVESRADDEPATDDPVGAFPRCERVSVHERGLTIECAGSQEEISTMVSEFENAGVDVSLRRLQSYRVQRRPLDVLTDRQREVLEVAFDTGYYDVPRSASTAEVAAALDLDDSTVSEHLQRAERNLLGSVLGRGT